MPRNLTSASSPFAPSRLPVRFGLALLLVYVLTAALCLLPSCTSLLSSGARSPSPSTVVDADSSSTPCADAAADSGATVPSAGSSSLVAPVPPRPNATAAQTRRYVRQMDAYSRAVARSAGPRKVKVTGSAAYAGPGATLAAATAKNAAAAGPSAQAVAAKSAGHVVPVLGDGSVVKLLPGQPAAKLPPDRFPASFPYWLLALAGLVAGYGLYRHFKTA